MNDIANPSQDAQAGSMHDNRPGADSNLKTTHRLIGSIIAEARNLTASQVESIIARQEETGARFGEAAIQLGLATSDDVLYALSQQFNYPYTPESKRQANPELVVLNEPFGGAAESFRAIRSQLMMRLFSGEHNDRALAVVSPNSGDGKSFFSANLAIALAQLGGRTLLIDADLRGPRQHQIFGLANNAGLSGILNGWGEAKVIQQIDAIPALFVLPNGITPPNPQELVERPAFGLLIREFLSKFDHVLVDTPAAQFGSDCSVIASRCGAALVIARKDKASVSNLEQLVASLSSTPATLAGVVYNEF
jgi:chain length determinant protein tyrosine kinase EpsG